MMNLRGTPKTIHCNFYNDNGEPLLINGRPGCPRTSAKCFYVHPEEPAWERSKPSRPRIDPSGVPYKPVASVSQASYAPRAYTPPRTYSPPPSMPSARPRSPPRSPALGSYRTRSPHYRARSPPSGPRALASISRPRSRTPVRRSPSPRRSLSREHHASTSDSRYMRERTGSNASTSAPSFKPDTHPGSPQAPRNGTGREWPVINTSTARQGSMGSDRMQDQSPSTPVTPVATTGLLEGRFQPINIVSRTHANGVKSEAPHPPTMPPPVSSLMPPPPVPPSHSDSSSNVAKPPQRELTFKEKRELWVERIKLLNEATIARGEHLKLTQEIEKYQRLIRSARYSSISDEDQERLNAQLSEMNGRLNAKKDELKALLHRIIEADFWGATANSPPKFDDFREEVQNIVAGLSKNMEKLHEQYEELRTKGLASLAGEPMDVDTSTQAHEGPPVKRRRLSIDGTVSIPNGDDIQRDGVQHRNAHDLDERLKEVEERITELEISGIERDNNLLDEVEDIVRHRIDEEQRRLKLDAPASKEPTDPTPQPPPVLLDPRIERIEKELKKTGNEVEELAIEVAGLITHMAQREEEHAQMAKVNQELRDRVAALEQQREADAASIDANKTELQAISAALQSFITQAPAQTLPPPPPPVQQIPSTDEILSKIQPLLIQSIHEDMKPYLKDTHDTVQTILQDQLNNVYGTLVTKMTPTIRTVDIVAQWMDRVRRGEPFVDSSVHSHNTQ